MRGQIVGGDIGLPHQPVEMLADRLHPLDVAEGKGGTAKINDSQHFDRLVREAYVPAHDMPAHLAELRRGI